MGTERYEKAVLDKKLLSKYEVKLTEIENVGSPEIGTWSTYKVEVLDTDDNEELYSNEWNLQADAKVAFDSIVLSNLAIFGRRETLLKRAADIKSNFHKAIEIAVDFQHGEIKGA